MNPCPRNRKPLALLAADALAAEQTQELREHLESCPGCLRYWQEMSKLCQLHSAAAEGFPEAPLSAAFHPKLVRRIKEDEAQSIHELIPAVLKRWFSYKPLAISTAAVALAALLLILSPNPRPSVLPPAPSDRPKVAVGLKGELQPTFSNYRIVANRSLEELDDLLTRQAVQPPAFIEVLTLRKLVVAD